MSEPHYIDHWLWVRDEAPVQQELPELPSAPVQRLDPPEKAELADYEAATQHGDELVKSVPDSHDAWFNLGFSFHKLNQMEEAAQAYAEAIKLQPDGTRARVNLAVILQQRGDRSGARQELERVLEREPGNASALWNLAILHEEDGHPEKAEAVYLRLIAIKHRSEEAAFKLGYLRFQRGNFVGAVEAFETCLIEQPNWRAAVLNLSLAQWRCGDRTLATATLEGALAQNPDTLRLRANLAIDGGEWKTTQDVEAQLSAAGENTSEIAYNIGVLQQRAGLHQQAVPTYKHALEQNPNFAEAWLNLGHAFKTLGQDGDAQSAWLAALAAKPELAAGYFKPVLQADRL
jgi:protein O-GlcNAc transferase